METLEHPRVYYRGCETLDRLVQVVNKADSINEFFKETGSESKIEYETFIDRDQYIIKFCLWRVS